MEAGAEEAIDASRFEDLQAGLAGRYVLEKFDEARRMYERLAAESLPSVYGNDHYRGRDLEPLGYLGIDAARRGDTLTAEAMLDSLARFNRDYMFGINVHWQSLITAQLDDCDRTVTLLQRALELGSPFNSLNNSYWLAMREIPQFGGVKDCAAFRDFMELR